MHASMVPLLLLLLLLLAILPTSMHATGPMVARNPVFSMTGAQNKLPKGSPELHKNEFDAKKGRDKGKKAIVHLEKDMVNVAGQDDDDDNASSSDDEKCSICHESLRSHGPLRVCLGHSKSNLLESTSLRSTSSFFSSSSTKAKDLSSAALHRFHHECLTKWQTTSRQMHPTCPICRGSLPALTLNDLQSYVTQRIPTSIEAFASMKAILWARAELRKEVWKARELMLLNVESMTWAAKQRLHSAFHRLDEQIMNGFQALLGPFIAQETQVFQQEGQALAHDCKAKDVREIIGVGQAFLEKCQQRVRWYERVLPVEKNVFVQKSLKKLQGIYAEAAQTLYMCLHTHVHASIARLTHERLTLRQTILKEYQDAIQLQKYFQVGGNQNARGKSCIEDEENFIHWSNRLSKQLTHGNTLCTETLRQIRQLIQWRDHVIYTDAFFVHSQRWQRRVFPHIASLRDEASLASITSLCASQQVEYQLIADQLEVWQHDPLSRGRMHRWHWRMHVNLRRKVSSALPTAHTPP